MVDSTLTDWDKAIALGSILSFNVDSATTVEWAMIELHVKLVA